MFGSPTQYALMVARGFDPAPGDFEHYISAYTKLHEVLGFSRGILVHSNVYGTNNTVTVDALKRLGKRYRGVALVNVGIKKAEMMRLSEAGVKAARVNLISPTDFDLDVLQRRAYEFSEIGWHVEIIMKCADLPALSGRLRKLPIDVVIDHHGLPDVNAGVEDEGFSMLIKMVKDGSVWVKASAAYRFSKTGFPYEDTRPFTRALVQSNPDRIVWGTDWPHVLYDGPMPNDGELLNLFLSEVGDQTMLKKILVDNPTTLYALSEIEL
jgi:predicted TIM-barrel fold metal-dependent hydrolase